MRKPAAKLFVSLLRDGDRAGIVSFDKSAKLLAPLTGTTTKRDRKKLFSAIDMINSRGLFTNIHEGLKKGHEAPGSSQQGEKILILMSDGQMDLGDKAGEEALTAELKDSLLPQITKEGTRIYTIAFTDSSDQTLLEEIARKTGGFYRLAKTGQDLHLVFASMFEKIKSPDSLPIKGGGFTVDKEVNELILLITKKTPETAVVIADPSAKEHKAVQHGPDMQWFASKAFDMVTVRQPAPGKWGVKFNSGEGDRVFIITDLNLLSSFNKDLVTQQGAVLKVDAWLEKDGAPIKVKDVLAHIKVSALVTPPDGKTVTLPLNDEGANGDSAAGDGVYTSQFTVDQSGDYSVRIIAEGETFQRAKSFAFRSAPKPPEPVKPAAAPVVPQAKGNEEDAVSWQFVLLRFLIVNLVIAVLAAAGFFSAKLLKKTKARKNGSY